MGNVRLLVEALLLAGLPHFFQIPIEEILRRREVVAEPCQGSVNTSRGTAANHADLNEFRDWTRAEHIKDQKRSSHPDERPATAAARFVGGLLLLLAHTRKIT